MFIRGHAFFVTLKTFKKMAIINPGSLISEIRGSIGDITFSRTSSGPVAKAKLVQDVQYTALQIAQRENMAAGIAAWQALTVDQFKEWDNFAKSEKRFRSIRHIYTPTAYNTFIRRWRFRFQIGGTNNPFNPLPLAIAEPLRIDLTPGTDELILSWKATKSATGMHAVVYASPAVSPGIHSVNPSILKVIKSFSVTGSSGSIDILPEMISEQGLSGADVGKKIFFRLRLINSSNYAESNTVTNFTSVTSDMFPLSWPTITLIEIGNLVAVPVESSDYFANLTWTAPDRSMTFKIYIAEAQAESLPHPSYSSFEQAGSASGATMAWYDTLAFQYFSEFGDSEFYAGQRVWIMCQFTDGASHLSPPVYFSAVLEDE